jgi:hypothetical protein
MVARQSMVLSGKQMQPPLQDAIIQTDALIHLVAPTIAIDGVLKTTNTASGLVLLNAGSQMLVSGKIVSAKDVRMNAGVNLQQDPAALLGAIDAAQLNGGRITIFGQGTIDAGGNVSLQAGGDVNVLSDAEVADGEGKLARNYIYVGTESYQEVTGTRQVDSGRTYTTYTQYESEVSKIQRLADALVQVESNFTQFKVTLSQVGYWKPNAPAGQQMREFFIEGVDYFNSEVNWDNAGTDALPDRKAESVTGDYKSTAYKTFTQLSDAQRQAVLNHLGYMPLFSMSYASGDVGVQGQANYQASQTDKVKVTRTRNGTTTQSIEDASWKNNSLRVGLVNVAGWKDKYILMPEGAQSDILRLVSEGEAKYLSADTDMSGTDTSGNWVSASDASVARKFVKGSTEVTSLSFAIGDVNWAKYGVSAPGTTSFNQLSDAQQMAVAASQGYSVVTDAKAGEWVGQYKDESTVLYKQEGSRTTADNAESLMIAKLGLSGWLFTSFEEDDKGSAVWAANYRETTGKRYFNLADRATTDNKDYVRAYDPSWSWEPALNLVTGDPDVDGSYTGKSYTESVNKFSYQTATTKMVKADSRYFDALKLDTTSLIQLTEEKRSSQSDAYQFSFWQSSKPWKWAEINSYLNP